MSDEIYSKIIFNDQEMPSFINYEAIRDRLIILEGWSKTFLYDWMEIGLEFVAKKLYEHANKLCVNDHSCPNIISQYAGLEALKGRKMKLTNKTRVSKRKNFVHKELNKLENMDCFEPGGAFYAFPNISLSGYNGQKFSDIALEEKGVASSSRN